MINLMTKKTTYIPTGTRLLVRVLEHETEGLVALPETARHPQEQWRAKVLAIGEMAAGNEKFNARVGDIILMSTTPLVRYVVDKEERLLLIDCVDVMAVIAEE
jgi:co-chaperonin GroES (HSP10)